MRLKKYITEEKKLSVGLVLTDGDVFLAVRPTGNTHAHYDLPKGLVDPGENYTDTVIREFKEETDIDISKYRSQLKEMGKFPYLNYKDVFVFLLKIKTLPPTSSMKCTSKFEMYPGKFVPEVNGFFYIPWEDFAKHFNSGMGSILDKVKKEIKNP